MTAPDIAKMREELSGAPIGEGRPMTPRRIIRSLMPEILAQRDQGVTLAELVLWFGARGVRTTTGAISNYIHEYQKESSGTSAAASSGTSTTTTGTAPSAAQRIAPPSSSGAVPAYRNL